MARSQVVQMCEEVASRVERAARRLRPPAWFRAAAASPRGFLLAQRRPSRLPPWPEPQPEPGQAMRGEQQPPVARDLSASGSRSAPATLTRRRDRNRQRAADAADEETWSRDAATLYATPLSSRRQRPQSDWQTAPLGGWDSTPPRRHRSQLTLRTASPAPASDAGWSQEARRPYLGWRSLERLSRRPWTPEERLAASLLERGGRSTPTPGQEAAASRKHSASTQADADTSRGRTATSTLQNGPVRTPQPQVTSDRTELTTQSQKQFKEPSPLTTRLRTLSEAANESNHNEETTSSTEKKSTELNGPPTGSPAVKDSTRNQHAYYENQQHLEQDTLPNVSSYPEVKSQKNPQHSALPLSTQIKTLTVRTTVRAVDMNHASDKDQLEVKDDTHYFLPASGDSLKKIQTKNQTETIAAPASKDTREENATTKQQHCNGPTQLPSKLKALSVTTSYSNYESDLSAKANDNHSPARDLLARSYEAAPLDAINIACNTTLAPRTYSKEGDDRSIPHETSTTSPSLHDRPFSIDQSLVSDSGHIRGKQLPTVELRSRSLEVTLPQRMTTNDTSRKLSVQEQFWVADDHSPSLVQEDPSLLILPLVKQSVARVSAAHNSPTGSSTAIKKPSPPFATSSPINASPGDLINTMTLPYPEQVYSSNTDFPSTFGTKTFDINQLHSVELRTRSVEIPMPQVPSAIVDPTGLDFSRRAATNNPSLPNNQEGSSRSSATTGAVSMPPVPRDRTFCVESPSLIHTGSSAFRLLPAVEFQSQPSEITLLPEATARPNSRRRETELIPSGLNHKHSEPSSPLVETSLTTIHVTSSPVVAEYRAVYPDSSPLLGRKPFTVKHVEAPTGNRVECSADSTKSQEVSLSAALPKPFEPTATSHSKIPVPAGSKPFSEKESTLTAQMDPSHKPLNHIHPTERTKKSSLPVTSVIRRPSYRVATRNEFNPSSRKKRSATGVNTAGDMVSSSVAPPTENHRTKTAPIAKPPRLRTKDNATSMPKPPPRQKQIAGQATERSDNVGSISYNTQHLPNGKFPLSYSALDSQLPHDSTGPTNTLPVSYNLPVSSKSNALAVEQAIPSVKHIPSPTLLTPLKYKPCTTTDL